MNKAQANALLQLIADLYLIINTPEELEPIPAPSANGKVSREAEVAS